MKPMTRIVFDPGQSPTDYAQAVSGIKAVSKVMGQPIDSDGFKTLSVDQCRSRMNAYYDAMKGDVDLWEIGNEVNGDWLGAPSDVSAKVSNAFDDAKSRGLKTALTLYFNSTCTTDPTYEMIAWARKNLADRVKNGVDYLLVSYYPEDCTGTPNWTNVFGQLHSMFPSAKLGFGEIGVKTVGRSWPSHLI